MSDFILELYSEEIPAGMQAGAAAQLEKQITDFFASFGVRADSMQSCPLYTSPSPRD